MELFFPDELEEALEIKAARPESLPISGGTDLMVDLNFRRRQPAAMLDLSRIGELARWGAEGSHFFLGAGVTYSRIINDLPALPPLAAASRTIGSPQIRNRGTVGGNLGTASPAGDILPVLAAFDAEVIIGAARGLKRSLAWSEFLTGPKRTCLAPNELILGVRWRLFDGPGIFCKIGSRNAMVIAVANLCLVLDEQRRTSRVSVGSVAPTVIRLRDVEALIDEVMSSAGVWDDLEICLDDDGIDQAVRLAEVSIAPIDDMRGSATYRRHACGVLLRRALAWALKDRARRGGFLADQP